MAFEELAWFGSALGFAISMSATPGPNNTMVAASGATWGFRRTLPHICGIAVGFPVMLLTVGLGAGELLRTVPWFDTTLRWLGAAYLLWLAWQIAIADPQPASEQNVASGPRPLSFLQAAVFQWVNPKAWIIALGAITAYTTVTGSLAQALVLALIFFVAALVCVGMWTMVGVGVGRLLGTRRAVRSFNVLMAALLVISLVPLVISN